MAKKISFQNAPFIQLFSALTADEYKKFGTYLNHLTKAENAIKLYQYCMKHKGEPLEKYWKKDLILSKVFDKNTLDSNCQPDANRQLNNALLELRNKLDDFLILNIIKKEENRKLLLLEIYRERRLADLFSQQLHYLKEKTTVTFLDFWRKIPVPYKSYYNDIKSSTSKNIDDFNYTLQAIEHLKLMTQLKFTCEALSRELIGIKDDVRFDLPESMLHQEFDHPVLATYKKYYYLLASPNEEEFDKLFDDLKKYYKSSSKKHKDELEEMATWLGYLINVASHLYQHGRSNFIIRIIELLQFGLREEDIINSADVTEELIFTIVAVGCHQNQVQKNNGVAQKDTIDLKRILGLFKKKNPNQKSLLALAYGIIAIYELNYKEVKTKLTRINYLTLTANERFIYYSLLLVSDFMVFFEKIDNNNSKETRQFLSDELQEKYQKKLNQFDETIIKENEIVYEERLLNLIKTLSQLSEDILNKHALPNNIAETFKQAKDIPFKNCLTRFLISKMQEPSDKMYFS